MNEGEAAMAVDRLRRLFRTRFTEDEQSEWASLLVDLDLDYDSFIEGARELALENDRGMPAIGAFVKAARRLAGKGGASGSFRIVCNWRQGGYAFVHQRDAGLDPRKAWHEWRIEAMARHDGDGRVRRPVTELAVELIERTPEGSDEVRAHWPGTDPMNPEPPPDLATVRAGADRARAVIAAARPAAAAMKSRAAELADMADPCLGCGAPATNYDGPGNPWCDAHLPSADAPPPPPEFPASSSPAPATAEELPPPPPEQQELTP